MRNYGEGERFLMTQHLGYQPEFAVKKEPLVMNEAALNEILAWASEIGASDINFKTNDPVTIDINGKFAHITKKKMSSIDLETITNILYDSGNGVSFIKTAGEIDTSYAIRNDQQDSALRFRVNITGCWAAFGAEGINITIRTIKGLPPTFSQLAVEQEIIDNFYPENGMVVVCGKTGSGKSTTLAAGVRNQLESRSNSAKWLLFESPTEYVYDEVERAADLIIQHEVPRHVASFAAAVRNSLRRAPTNILIGECRDYATISASIEAAETGHALYTTLHANSVPEALYRALNMFPMEERSSKLFEVVESFRLVMAQKLVRTVTGGRVALREYLVFDQVVRERLRQAQSLKEAVSLVSVLVEERGQSMLKSALREFELGHISKAIVEKLEDDRRNIVDDFDTEF